MLAWVTVNTISLIHLGINDFSLIPMEYYPTRKHLSLDFHLSFCWWMFNSFHLENGVPSKNQHFTQSAFCGEKPDTMQELKQFMLTEAKQKYELKPFIGYYEIVHIFFDGVATSNSNTNTNTNIQLVKF